MFAIVVYTGSETKLMKNLGAYSFKHSKMEKRLRNTLIINLCFLAFFITICSIWNALKTKSLIENHIYLNWNSNNVTTTSLQSVVSFYLLFDYLIPLDLAVMLELNAIFYSGYLSMDAKMTYINR